MKRDKTVSTHNGAEKLMERLSGNRAPSIAGFVALLLLYVAAYVFTARSSHAQDVVMLFGHPTPIASFTGVFSTLGNFCIIFLVVFYGKTGFFTALGLLLVQLTLLALQIFKEHNMAAAPGMFSALFTILVIFLFYNNYLRVQKYQVRLQEQAITDQLTGLPNRFACSELINRLVERQERFAVVSIDLNHFKAINNTMGRATGNQVLAEIARRWERAVNSGASGTRDFIACQGGVEFALVIQGYQSDADIIKTINCYNAVLEQKLTLDDCDYYITARYGYSEYPDDAFINVIEFDSEKYFHTVRYEAKKAGLNIKQTAELLGAHYRTVQSWFNGTRQPPAWLERLIVKEIQAAV